METKMMVKKYTNKIKLHFTSANELTNEVQRCNFVEAHWPRYRGVNIQRTLGS